MKSFRLPNNHEYSGEINTDNQPNGIGILIYNTDNGITIKHCGTFIKGLKDGGGIEYIYNSNDNSYTRFSGTWCNDIKICGKLTQFDENNSFITQLYEGFLNENGQYHGEGTIFHVNGKKKYKGKFVNGNVEGKGTLYFENGSVRYKGKFLNNEFHDQYAILYNKQNQIIYEGAFEYNKRCGRGKEYTYSHGKTILYEGFWNNDQYHGQGTLRKNTFIYTGEFKNGKFDGYGIIDYRTEEMTYKGYFKNGLRHGKGKLTSFGDYSIDYEGDWIDDKKEGYGIYKKYGMYPQPYRNIPSIYEGHFINDMFNGKGKYTYYHGDTYDGSFLNNKRHGFGIMCYTSTGKKYEGDWKEDMKYGPGKLYNRDGHCTVAVWERDRIVSKSKKRINNYVQPLLPTEKKQRIEQIEEKQHIDIPHEFKCPIGLSIMKYPIICSDGHTYDAEHVNSLFNRLNKVTSPITREILDKDIRIPNHNLRKMIEEFLKNNS